MRNPFAQFLDALNEDPGPPLPPQKSKTPRMEAALIVLWAIVGLAIWSYLLTRDWKASLAARRARQATPAQETPAAPR